MCYVKGKHNQSPYNLARLNNEDCHLGKNLHNDETQAKFMLKTKKHLDSIGYKPNENDLKFQELYYE